LFKIRLPDGKKKKKILCVGESEETNCLKGGGSKLVLPCQPKAALHERKDISTNRTGIENGKAGRELKAILKR